MGSVFNNKTMMRVQRVSTKFIKENYKKKKIHIAEVSSCITLVSYFFISVLSVSSILIKINKNNLEI